MRDNRFISQLLKDTELMEPTNDRDAMVQQWTPLVVRVATNMDMNKRFPIEDRVSVGLVTLLKCIDNFDPENGASFMTYAYRSIQREIARNSYRLESTLSLPMSRNTMEKRTGTRKTNAQYQMSESKSLANEENCGVDSVSELDNKEECDLMLSTLPDHYADIVRRWINGETLQEIADSRGVFKQSIHQQLQRALHMLRKSFPPPSDNREPTRD